MDVLIRYFPESPTWPERAEGIAPGEVKRRLEADEIERIEPGVYREKGSQAYQTKVMVPGVEVEDEDWRAHRKAVAKLLDKDIRKVTKAEVEDYLAQQES
jgi:hypothetical protein